MLKRFHSFKIIRLTILFVLASVCVASVWKGGREIKLFLPGTQPGQADTAATVGSCALCHVAQFREWSGSMMAHAPRNPFFNAMISITSKTTMDYGLDVGEYCLRCHAPSGWLAGRSHFMTVNGMYGSDLDGVHCDFCHRMVDPMHPDSTTIVADDVPGIGNGMYATQKFTLPVRGARGNLAHPCLTTIVDSFYRKSEYCGVCHDESNPYLSENARRTPPHLQIAQERTYSEWKLSWFATRGDLGTCQACHMPRLAAFGSSLPGTRFRVNIASHDFSGGNTMGPPAVLDSWQGIDRKAIDDGLILSRKLLREKTATLEISAGRTNGNTQVLVRVTNLTGHKLPTGFPGGRQMWLSVIGRDWRGNVVFESGTYDSSAGEIRHPDQLKLYEIRLGVSHALASAKGLIFGRSLNDALSDTTFLDNRIPPRGFALAAFTERRAQPVGYHYGDGQYWDVTSYSLPHGTYTVEVALNYQVMNKQFAEYLQQENMGNPYDWNKWGEKSLALWRSYGAPTVIAREETYVASGPPQLGPVKDFALPFEIHMSQNYPNPFNSESIVEFWLSETASASIILYDVTGREVSRPLDASLSGGSHTVRFNGSQLASGMYFYRLIAGGKSETKKFLLIR